MLLDRLYKWMDLSKTGKSQQATDQIYMETCQGQIALALQSI